MQSQLIPILALAARTATGSAAIDQAPSLFTEANIYVDVTAVSGTTPSFTFSAGFEGKKTY